MEQSELFAAGTYASGRAARLNPRGLSSTYPRVGVAASLQALVIRTY